jgi:hypothetical protein
MSLNRSPKIIMHSPLYYINQTDRFPLPVWPILKNLFKHQMLITFFNRP